MAVDWNAVATIAAPIFALFAGVWINRWFENRPRLISYYGHVAAFQVTPTTGPPYAVHTHQVVLLNSGRVAATNLRLHHHALPDFIVWPAVHHTVQVLPNGSKDIVIPVLIPGKEITVSYLYFPPLMFGQVNAGIECDQGFAQQIPVLLQRQLPRWAKLLAALLMIVGLVSLLYVAYVVVSRLIG